MASYTEHLNLLKKNPATDGADTFNIETMLNENWDKIDEAVAKKAELGADGKIPAEQLPEMNYDKAGSAEAVQKNLDAHTGNRSNPHGVTASQVGAVPIDFYGDDIDNLVTAGFYRVQAGQNLPTGIDYGNVIVARNPGADTVLQIAVSYSNQFMYFRGGIVKSPANEWQPWSKVSIDGHTHDASQIVSGILPLARGGTGVPTIAQLAQSLFPIQIGSLPDTSYNFAITGPGWSGNGYMNFQALMSQITANGGCRIASGSYVGNGLFGESNPTVLQFPFKPKYVTIPTSVDTSDDGFLELISVYNAAGNPILAVDSVPTGSEYSPGDNRISGPLGYYTCYRYDNNTNTLYFYSKSSGGAGHQKNAAGVTYYWIAIG